MARTARFYLRTPKIRKKAKISPKSSHMAPFLPKPKKAKNSHFRQKLSTLGVKFEVFLKKQAKKGQNPHITPFLG
jgi:hypothetical protein